jgi:putative hydrolase of HD superfamily
VNVEPVLDLLLRANQLKLVPRSGWAMRGLADVESVSDHTFGVAFTALVLAHVAEMSVDVAKVLTIALIHDLPEAVLGDIPSPASSYFPPQAKQSAEAEVLTTLLAEVPRAGRWYVWWREYETGDSVEGRLVQDADRLDMLIQAYVYEQTTGNRWLDEFWAGMTETDFAFEVSQSLFAALRSARARGEEAV